MIEILCDDSTNCKERGDNNKRTKHSFPYINVAKPSGDNVLQPSLLDNVLQP